MHEKIAKLRERMIHAKAPFDVLETYLETVVVDPELAKMASPYDDASLKATLARVLAAAQGATSISLQTMVVRIEQYKFVHGYMIVNGKLAVMILFEEENMGVASFEDKNGVTGCVRFSWKPYQPSKAPSTN